MSHGRTNYQLFKREPYGADEIQAPVWTIETDHEADKRLRGQQNNGELAEPGLRQQS